MIETPLISIVVAIYNVEMYLDRCIESVIGQTYKNIEIILVDDGSTDSCPKICDAYKENDKRIIVIHQKNKGLSGARNAGIDMASGEYIGFVDSDDYLHESMYEKLIENAIATEAEISMCCYKRFSGKVCKAEDMGKSKVTAYTAYEILEMMYGWDGEIYTVAWNKLYQRKVIADIRYPIRKINEDEFTTYRIIGNAKKIVCTDEVLYYYFLHNKSITGNFSYLLNEDIYEAFDERKVYFNERNYIKLAKLLEKQYLDRIIVRYKKALEFPTKDKGNIGALLQRYRIRFKKLNGEVGGLGYKIFYISPVLYNKVVNIKKIMRQ